MTTVQLTVPETIGENPPLPLSEDSLARQLWDATRFSDVLHPLAARNEPYFLAWEGRHVAQKCEVVAYCSPAVDVDYLRGVALALAERTGIQLNSNEYPVAFIRGDHYENSLSLRVLEQIGSVKSFQNATFSFADPAVALSVDASRLHLNADNGSAIVRDFSVRIFGDRRSAQEYVKMRTPPE